MKQGTRRPHGDGLLIAQTQLNMLVVCCEGPGWSGCCMTLHTHGAQTGSHRGSACHMCT